MEKYCKKLKEWVMKIVNYEMKDMIPLTRDEKNITKNKINVPHVVKDFVVIKKIKIIKKFVIIVITLVNIEVWLTVFVICGMEQKKFL